MITLPAKLVESVDRWGPPERKQWLIQLPTLIESLAQRWSLDVGPAYQPGGEVSWVAPARDSFGRELVLKLSWRHPEGEHEAAGLLAWQGRGTVMVYNTHVEGCTNGLLVERCVPGTSLGSLRPEPEQDEVMASLLRRLWHELAPGHPFRPLAELCDAWAQEFFVASPATIPGRHCC
jgi:streptomycin 6-kinase